MQSYILIGALIGLPVLLGLFFRVSVSHLFFSLLAGELLERYFSDDGALVMATFTKNEAVLAYAGFIILVLPIVLTAIILKRTLSKGKVVVQFLPMLVTGIVFAAFAIHVLPENVQMIFKMTDEGAMIYKSTDVIVGALVFMQLVTLWLLNRPKEKLEGHKKHH